MSEELDYPIYAKHKSLAFYKKLIEADDIRSVYSKANFTFDENDDWYIMHDEEPITTENESKENDDG